MNKQFKLIGIFIAVVIFMLSGCNKQAESPFEVTTKEISLPLGLEEIAAMEMQLMSIPDCIIEANLWAGAAANDLSKGTLVGNVVAFAWGDYVYVKYHILRENCYLVNTHTYVSDKKPLTAVPGQFIYKMKFSDPYPTEYMLTIPWQEKGWQCDTILYIAAHATVYLANKGLETAWAYGNYSFIGEGISNKWGWFFDLLLCCRDD